MENPTAQGWNGVGVRGGGVRAVTKGAGSCAGPGPNSQLEEGIQEVLTTTQTSRSLVRSRTKAAAPRDECAMPWPVGWRPGQETMAPRTARPVTWGSLG